MSFSENRSPLFRDMRRGALLMRLSATDLACRRGGRDVFAGVNFSLASGESLAIRGRNGAGKSSLLRMVVGLVRVASGRLSLAGGDPELTIGEQAHYLGHLDALKPSLSVAENLQFWSAFFGADNAGLNEPLRAVGLDALADLPAAYLSAGQRRRLSIARLLAVKRPLWLLDEPTSTLDAAAQVRLAEIMQAHLAGGGIILAATHGALGLDDTRELRLADTPPPAFVEEDQGGREQQET
jgi:heme exporter protein A